MLEDAFQANVIELARRLGWKVHHDRGDYRDCIGGDPGFPDLVLARAGTVLFPELKTEDGKLSIAQQEWLNELGDQANVWRPSDIDQIAHILSRAP